MNPSRAALEQSLELAVSHHRAGDLARAEQLYRQILEIDPRHAETLHLLALIAFNGGYREEAEGLLRRALAATPREAEFHNTLGVVCQATGRLEEAAKCFRTAIKRRPAYAEAMSNLSGVLNDQNLLSEAVQWARRAIAIRPGYPEALNNLANSLLKQGLAAEAAAAFRACTDAAPRQWAAWSNLLFVMHNLPEISPEELFALHVRVGKEMAASGPAPASAHPNGRDPERRLRIGYVSADFRMHSVGYFVLPILQAHDRAAVEVFCYADLAKPDEVTARAQSLAAGWRPIGGLADDAVERIIREDRIDVLVDLAGHTMNRLLVFARKVAPVQVTYLGYPDTTGLPAMDYRLTDSLADPAGDADTRATEKLVRIDPCAWCYEPPAAAPEVAPARSGAITFGTFNALVKISPPVIEAWAAILRAVPESRLLVKAAALNEAATRERFSHAFAAHGVDRSRLLLRGFSADMPQHLAQYGEMDIALDPFPYQGTTTTCEALWMGVPVVSLAGRAHAGRVGVSLLHAVGLGELVARDVEDYVRTAVRLAGERPRLAVLRGELRERMRDSALMDAAGFCRRLEGAYREMWRRWCGEAQL